MKVRTLLLGLTFFSSRILSAHPVDKNLLHSHSESDKLTTAPDKLVETENEAPRCMEKQPAPPVVVNVPSINLNDIVFMSDSVKKNQPEAGEKFLRYTKKVLDKLLQNDRFACKFQFVTEMPAVNILIENTRMLVPFKIVIAESPELNANQFANYHFLPRLINTIKLSIDLFHTHYSENSGFQSGFNVTLSELLIHENQHAYQLANAFGAKSAKEYTTKVLPRFKDKALSRSEAESAPYANSRQKAEFSAIIARTEEKIDDLMESWIDVIFNNNKKNATRVKMIEELEPLVGNYNPSNKFIEKAPYSPVGEMLLRLSAINETVSAYPEHERLFEKDAYYHQMLTQRPGLFFHINSDLDTWDDKHGSPSYNKCRQQRPAK